MADNTVMQTIYGREFIGAFEQKQSFLRACVTTEGNVNGDNYIFIIEGIADEAKERGSNGNIPYANDDQAPVTCTMKEYHFLARKNRFRIFSSSVPQRLSMQRRGVVSINYKTDKLIIEQLATTTYTTNGGSAGVNKDVSLMGEASALLDAAYVPDDGERYGLLTPMAYQQALRIQQFTSWDYVEDMNRPFMKYVQWRQWNGIKWARHPNLPGKGTSSASCFVFHKSAIGHALNQGEMVARIGENEEQDYSWARTTSYMGAKTIQLAGIIKMLHNDTTALNA